MERYELEKGDGYFVEPPDLDNDLEIEVNGDFHIFFSKADVEHMRDMFNKGDV